jgi:hypothetical protein
VIIELAPWLLLLVGFLLQQVPLQKVGFFLVAVIYPFLGWYLFKSKVFSFGDIVFASFFGVLLFVILIGFSFFLTDQNYGVEMLVIARYALNIGFFLSLIFMIIRSANKSSREYEFTMSQKVFSRFAGLMIFFFAAGLNLAVEEALNAL